MVPSYPHSVSSLMPLDLNEDQNHELSTPNQYHSSSSFSSASLSYPILLRLPDHDQDQEISYYTSQPKPLQNEEAEKIIPSSGSWDDLAAENQQSRSKLKLKVWKKERNIENLEAEAEEPEGGCSVKWMSSKMRMMRKMMVSDHQHKFEDQKQPLSPLGTDTSSNNNNNNYSNSNHTIRVCSDCHTTKTPLWRSGPRGPKSLCNACGIRQRKARRAMAAAAAAAGANGTTVVAVETTVKKNKLQKKKDNKSKFEFASSTHMNKKKRKLGVGAKPISDHSQSRKKLCFEDLRLSLINNFALQQVFPQDEKEAAILLMALSYGLVHG